MAAEGYVGIDVHRAARVAVLAHGGQLIAVDGQDAPARCYCIPVSIVRLAVLMRPLRTRTTRGVTPEPRRKAVVVTEYRPGVSRTRYVPFALVVTLARTPPSCEKRSNTRLAGFEHEAASTHSGPLGDSVTLPWTPDGVCPARAAPEAPTNSASSVGKSHFRAA